MVFPLGHVWGIISVSYTHLDVYKRQVIDNGRLNNKIKRPPFHYTYKLCTLLLFILNNIRQQ